MRAVVLDREPRRLTVTDDWPEPEPGPGEVLVAVGGVGICGSDLALHAARRQPPAFPWVVGHETFGQIVAAGDGVDGARTGQHVIVEPNIPCLACPACASGRTSACPRRRSLGFTTHGTLAERITVPAPFAWPLPASWDETDAVCAEPLVVARAAIRRATAGPTATARTLGRCLVVGAGSQGALLNLALVTQGITPAVLEPHAGRRRLAESLGARPAGHDETGFGLIFETSGTPGGLTEAVSRAGNGALIMLIGQSGQPAGLVTQTVVQRQLTLAGSLIYDHPGDFAAALTQDGTRAGRVLRACYPMSRAEEAFANAREVPGKTWIRVQGG